MLSAPFQTLWSEPAIEAPPNRVWRDWVLVTTLLCTTVVEVVFQSDLVWPLLSVPFVLLAIASLLWRRTLPFLVTGGMYSLLALTNVVTILWSSQEWNMYSTACILILPYSLFRWGSGRHMLLTTPIVAVTALMQSFGPEAALSDGPISLLFFFVPAELGYLIRSRRLTRQRTFEKMKLQERELLARELHDTVAHHVSAIAIQAQAGRFLADSESLKGAANALAIIEEEASRALEEMRLMVEVLRDGETPDMAPQRGVAEIEDLARTLSSASQQIVFSQIGDLSGLGAAVEAAIYRIAQESITNAVRHAQGARHIRVDVLADGEMVELRVEDDGRAGAGGVNPSGYGLVGMAERATLLGGTFQAGPRPLTEGFGGWLVQARIPRQESHPNRSKLEIS